MNHYIVTRVGLQSYTIIEYGVGHFVHLCPGNTAPPTNNSPGNTAPPTLHSPGNTAPSKHHRPGNTAPPTHHSSSNTATPTHSSPWTLSNFLFPKWTLGSVANFQNFNSLFGNINIQWYKQGALCKKCVTIIILY